MANNKQNIRTTEIRNKKASHDYFIGEKFECGVVLTGAEVKSIRLGHCQINDAFIRPDKHHNLFLLNAHISEYKFTDSSEQNTTRQRRILLHKQEIRKILSAIERDKMSILPIRMYLKHRLIKLEIAICKGKKLFDKREALKKNEALREAQRAIASAVRHSR